MIALLLLEGFQPQNILILFLLPTIHSCLLMAIITVDVSFIWKQMFQRGIYNNDEILTLRIIKNYRVIYHNRAAPRYITKDVFDGVQVILLPSFFLNIWKKKIILILIFFLTSQPQIVVNLFLFLAPISASLF